jgi:hypothetical protein
MARRPHAVFGIYPDQLSTEDAIETLRAAGFSNTDISVLFPENQGNKDIGHEKHTKAPEGAVAGGASGAVIGGALGWLAGIGALAIPGVGPFVAAGPIMAMLGGIGVGSTVGGLTGALVGAGIPEYEAKRYEGRIRHGGILLSVHCEEDESIGRAKKILRDTGADDISSTTEERVGVAHRPVDRATTREVIREETPVTARPVESIGTQTSYHDRVATRIVEPEPMDNPTVPTHAEPVTEVQRRTYVDDAGRIHEERVYERDPDVGNSNVRN